MSARSEGVVRVGSAGRFERVIGPAGFVVRKRGLVPFPTLRCVFKIDPFHLFSGRRQPVLAVLVALALTWSVASSLSIYPHSLSYFNELAAILPTPADASYPKPIAGNVEHKGVLSMIASAISAGPRNGPRHLLDSNIDWGQDLFYLKGWLDKHAEAKLDGLAVWGSYPPKFAGIPETPMPAAGPWQREYDPALVDSNGGPRPGWYALSVNYIYSRDCQYRYFLYFEPVAMAGYSIYIYHITLDDANRVRGELGLGRLPEEWQPQGDTRPSENVP